MNWPSKDTWVALALGLGFCSLGLMILIAGGFGRWHFYGVERLLGLVYLAIGCAVLYFYFCD